MKHMKNKFHHLKLTRSLVILDLETTGIDVQEDRIVELAAIRFTPGINLEKYHTRINPDYSSVAEKVSFVVG